MKYLSAANVLRHLKNGWTAKMRAKTDATTVDAYIVQQAPKFRETLEELRHQLPGIFYNIRNFRIVSGCRSKTFK